MLRDERGIQELLVECSGRPVKAVCYTDLSGSVVAGDSVLLNTTAVKLDLGSGGRHFLIASLDRPEKDLSDGGGHIMKMRYTPLQFRVLSAEEEGSPHREKIEAFSSLGAVPVAICGLHSMLAPVCATLKKLRPGLRIVYIMTDGACLPLKFSRTAGFLRENGYIEATVTCGNAFGGDLEAVNKYSALAAARAALEADVIVVAMGVGITGTGTSLGHTGMEAGEWVNAVAALGGRPVVVPRLSFADRRVRHNGISHHTLTALGVAALVPAVVPFPELEGGRKELVERQIDESGLSAAHDVRVSGDGGVLDLLDAMELKVTTMGRGPAEDPEFFRACGAAAEVIDRMIG